MKNKIIVNDLVKSAFLVALSIVLSRFLGVQLTPNMKISFASLPLMLVGMLYGPLLGGLAGFAADFIGVMINLTGTFHLGFTLMSILTGLVPGLIIRFAHKKNYNIKIQILLVVLFVFGIVNFFMTPIWLTQLYGTPYNVLLVTRAPKVIIDAIINYVLLLFIYPRLIKFQKSVRK